MYKLPPFSQDFEVKPKEILYHLPSYHTTASPQTTLNGCCTPTDVAALAAKLSSGLSLGQQQADLKSRLLNLEARLDAFIKNSLKSGGGAAIGEKKEQKGDAVPDKSSKKADKKDAKKAERKEKKESAKATATQGKENTADQGGKKEGNKADNKDKRDSAKPSNVSQNSEQGSILVKDYSANSPKLVHLAVSATSSVFPVHDYKTKDVTKEFQAEAIELSVRQVDLGLIRLVTKIGAGRGVHFLFDDKKKQGNGVSIKVSSADSILVNLPKKNLSIRGPIAVWKFLGTLIGVYSSSDALTSAQIDYWLLLGAQSSPNLDELARTMSAFLGRFDFLSGSNAVCLSDLVLRSMFLTQSNELIQWEDVKAANSVQTWVKRVDEALAAL